MASFTKRGSTWQYTVSRMVDGKSKPIRKGGFRTKKEASIAAAEVEADLRKGIIPNIKKIALEDYFEEWLKVYKSKAARTTTERYTYSLKTIQSYFKGKAIQDISKRDYQIFINEYARTHAKETIRKLNTHIRACIREAIDEGIIRVDFTRDVKVTSDVVTKRPEEKHLSYEESKQLLNEIYKRLDRSLAYYVILLALTSGMRFGEIVGLTRKDFDFKTNKISINKTWDYKTGKGFEKTKNDPSIRTIKMDSHTMDLFKKLFQKTPDNIHNLAFYSPNSANKVVTNEFTNRILKKMLKHLNITVPITIHGLRHTHASVLLYRKISIYYVSERLGHANIDTTLKHYAHVVKELREEDTDNTIKTFEQMISV
jgi:integrase